MEWKRYHKARDIAMSISATKGSITKLTQYMDRTKDVIKKEEMEKKLLTYFAKLSNLKEEFKQI